MLQIPKIVIFSVRLKKISHLRQSQWKPVLLITFTLGSVIVHYYKNTLSHLINLPVNQNRMEFN